MTTKNKTTRVALSFRQELNEIREDRKEMGLGNMSDRKATSLIIKWKGWPQLKKDLTNFSEGLP